eukprot:5874988-Prymnesium_polylepis.1
MWCRRRRVESTGRRRAGAAVRQRASRSPHCSSRDRPSSRPSPRARAAAAPSPRLAATLRDAPDQICSYSRRAPAAPARCAWRRPPQVVRQPRMELTAHTGEAAERPEWQEERDDLVRQVEQRAAAGGGNRLGGGGGGGGDGGG